MRSKDYEAPGFYMTSFLLGPTHLPQFGSYIALLNENKQKT